MKTRYDTFRLLFAMKSRSLLKLFLAWAVVTLIRSLALACAVCVTGATDDPTADAYNWSVIFLMTTPYLVVGSIAGWLFHTYRRAAAKRGQSEAAEPLVHLAWNQKESER